MRLVTAARGAFVITVAALLLAGCGRGSTSRGLPDFADLVERVSPSVVNISAIPLDPPQTSDAGDGGNHRDVPDWLKKFLEKHGGGEGAAPAPDAEEGNGSGEPAEESPDAAGPNGEQSLGSGFVLWSEGYIITNHHVVRDAKDIVVRLADRRQFPATLVGSDERSDIALLKIDASDLHPVKVADVRKTRVGEWVLAIGSPFGFDYTVTSGILSAKGRNLPSEQYVPFLQTDAAVNPGNSGGPLFNLDGEVVGVNSQIYSQSGGFQGVAFAIPIDVAVKVAKALRDSGKVERGWLGIVMQEVDRNLARSFGLDKPGGALIARVFPDSPAQQAGLKAGDIIVRYNGQEVTSWQAIKPLVGDSQPGEIVTLDVLREGRSITMKVEVGRLEAQDQPEPPVHRNDRDGDGSGKPPASPVPAPQAGPAPGTSSGSASGSSTGAGGEGSALFGVQVETLADDERRNARVTGGGVKVVKVQPGPGRDAGLIPGDVVLAIAGQEIGSKARFGEVVGRLSPGQSVPMLVQRQGSPLFLALSVPARP